MHDGPTRVTAPLLDVLEAFLDAETDELHGWAIIKATHRGGPTVYKILERLTDMGWVTPRWEVAAAEPDRPRRRYYKLTNEATPRARALVAAHRPKRSSTILDPAPGGCL